MEAEVQSCHPIKDILAPLKMLREVGEFQCGDADCL